MEHIYHSSNKSSSVVVGVDEVPIRKSRCLKCHRRIRIRYIGQVYGPKCEKKMAAYNELERYPNETEPLGSDMENGIPDVYDEYTEADECAEARGVDDCNECWNLDPLRCGLILFHGGAK